MIELNFRTPTQCQNGHFRWMYWTAKDGYVQLDWGEPHPECNCPRFALEQGFKVIGEYEQCTGIKDIEGKKIYRGDILKTVILYPYKQYKKINIVELDTVNPCFVLKEVGTPDGYEYDFDKVGCAFHKIIGNIHEHKHLLNS